MKFVFKVYYVEEGTSRDSYKYVHAKSSKDAMEVFKKKFPHLEPAYVQ